MLPKQAEDGALESKSLWYRYKTAVWLQDTPERAVVHNIMRVLRSIRNLRQLAYVSVPITSGLFFYEYQLANPGISKADLMRAVISHNYNLGWQLVENLRQRKDYPVLYPADLVPIHQKWEQAHFQALWLSIIGELCTEVHMSRGWQYSNGGVEEFLHVWQLKLGIPRHTDLLFFNTNGHERDERERMKNMVVYNWYGKPLTLQEGVQLIEEALVWLRSKDFQASQLEQGLELLRWTDHMLQSGFYQ